MSRITRALLVLALVALAAPAGATAAPSFVSVGSFDSPIHAASPPRDTHRLFVVERAGRVWIVKDGHKLAAPFLDISGEIATDGERGLLSIAFPPDYESSGRFYVYMVAADPLGELQVREYQRSSNPDVANPAGRIVWSTPHDQASNHNGGTIDFGPDGLLWFATGDGGGSNNQFGHARDLGSQLGKLLRIDPRPGNGGGYTIPPDNPFGTAVWAYGLRNPYRFSFDTRGTRDLFIGDVGQNAREEIDWAPVAGSDARGGDFGWSCREGTIAGPTPCTPGANDIEPIWDYGRSGDSPRAVTGGYLVRDPGLPTLLGRYVYADTYDGIVRSLVPARPRATDDRPAGLPARSPLVSFGEDACGHLYVVSLDGSVERVQDGAPGPCVLRPAPAPLTPPAPPVAIPPVRPAGRPDRTKPRVRIEIARRGKVGLRATPRIALVATEACRVTVTATVAKVRFKRVRGSLRAGRRTIVRLRPGRRGVKRIHAALRRHRRLTLTVSVKATDAAGNTGRAKRRLKVRRG